MTTGKLPRVVEAGLRQWLCAYERYVEEPHALGQMVVVREGPFAIAGVVSDIESGPEDATRPLSPRGASGQSATEVMAENPEIRVLLRTRMTVISCGYFSGEAMFPVLPPVPPPLLAEVSQATPEEVRSATAAGAFLSLLVAAPGCDDEVIAASLKRAANCYGEGAAREFVVASGKELSRLLRADPSRLATIIRSTGL